MRLIRGALAVVFEHKRSFIAINAVFYGLLVAGMVVAALFPTLQEQSLAAATAQVEQPGVVGTAADAYASGDVVLAAVLTFLVNLLVAAVLLTTVPSMVVPFAGAAVTFYRAAQWGVLFAPIGPDAVAILPHLLTLVIEGQAYVVATFAAWVHARKFLLPRRSGLATRWEGYRAGLLDTLRLYPLVVVLLAVGAIYEAVELILVLPLLS